MSSHLPSRRVQIQEARSRHIYLEICIPKIENHILPDDEDFWALVPTDPSQPQLFERRNILVAQRIFSIHKAIRLLLVKMFCPSDIQDLVVADPAENNCLIHLYLGSKAAPLQFQKFALQNFELTSTRMDIIGLGGVEKTHYAEAIAEGLALIHWSTDWDGRDVEFVLGTDLFPVEIKEFLIEGHGKIVNTRVKGLDFCHRKIGVWMIDFNQCRLISKDAAGAYRAALAHWDNAPYYPRPDWAGEEDNNIWNAFENAYVNTAALLDPNGQKLGELNISAVKVECKTRYPAGAPSSAPPMKGPALKGSGMNHNKGRHGKKGKSKFIDLDSLMK
ncbi:hypothetical protein N7495_004859 [Penicillium taxi]|uniref:uncharacterized protein n=1 Tax=Penicillium taxi TaxID=168475 RepID=UPI0025453D71|nr:uncharacterized protein N7495_004859 [Penicillium taxi]KAJ5900115.1 hypothetical protein N7495_004859 [Penicillium taxi]